MGTKMPWIIAFTESEESDEATTLAQSLEAMGRVGIVSTKKKNVLNHLVCERWWVLICVRKSRKKNKCSRLNCIHPSIHPSSYRNLLGKLLLRFVSMAMAQKQKRAQMSR